MFSRPTSSAKLPHVHIPEPQPLRLTALAPCQNDCRSDESSLAGRDAPQPIRQLHESNDGTVKPSKCFGGREVGLPVQSHLVVKTHCARGGRAYAVTRSPVPPSAPEAEAARPPTHTRHPTVALARSRAPGTFLIATLSEACRIQISAVSSL